MKEERGRVSHGDTEEEEENKTTEFHGGRISHGKTEEDAGFAN